MKQYLKCLTIVAFVALIVSPTIAPKRHIMQKPAVLAALKPIQPAPAPVTPIPQPVFTPHQQLLQQAGIAESDWAAVTYIFDHESGWCPTKSEGEIGVGCPAYHGYSSAGYGMCQSTPAIKMASMGTGWETDPVVQIKWCNNYAIARYGGWQGAYQRWLAYHNW